MEPLERISIEEASRLLNIHPNFLRCGLQQNKFPFGFGVKMTRWAYVVYKDKLMDWIENTPEEVTKNVFNVS